MSSGERIADGVHRLGTSWVGWYLVAGETVTVVDCGFPAYHHQLPKALAALGRPLDSVEAVVLTHYHSDHVGSAERIREATGATVYVPVPDAEGMRSGKVPMPPGMAASLWRPRMVRYMAHAAAKGGAKMRPVERFETYKHGDRLPGPGGLRAIHTPGHTAGHSCLLAEERRVLFAGDALATVSLLNGQDGPQLLPFNEDGAAARASLERLEAVDAEIVAVGHGSPFRGAPAEAVAAAQT